MDNHSRTSFILENDFRFRWFDEDGRFMKKFSFVIYALMLFCACGFAEKAKVDIEVENLLVKVSKAHGVEKASKTLKSLKTVLEAGMMGMKMEVISISAENKAKMITQVNGQVIAEQAYDGENVWSKDLMTGLRDLSGSEAYVVQLNTIEYILGTTEFFDKITMGKHMKLGEYDVVVLNCEKEGMEPAEIYIDKKTFRIQGSKLKVKTIQGEIEVQEICNSFKTLPSGLVIRDESDSVTGPVKMKLKLKSFEENPTLDASIFSKP